MKIEELIQYIVKNNYDITLKLNKNDSIETESKGQITVVGFDFPEPNYDYNLED